MTVPGKLVVELRLMVPPLHTGLLLLTTGAPGEGLITTSVDAGGEVHPFNFTVTL